MDFSGARSGSNPTAVNPIQAWPVCQAARASSARTIRTQTAPRGWNGDARSDLPVRRQPARRFDDGGFRSRIDYRV